jgi:hypothetical protein
LASEAKGRWFDPSQPHHFKASLQQALAPFSLLEAQDWQDVQQEILSGRNRQHINPSARPAPHRATKCSAIEPGDRPGMRPSQPNGLHCSAGMGGLPVSFKG